MSLNIALDPVCSRTGQVAKPPNAKSTHIAFDPICRYALGPQTVVPDLPETR